MIVNLTWLLKVITFDLCKISLRIIQSTVGRLTDLVLMERSFNRNLLFQGPFWNRIHNLQRYFYCFIVRYIYFYDCMKHISDYRTSRFRKSKLYIIQHICEFKKAFTLPTNRIKPTVFGRSICSAIECPEFRTCVEENLDLGEVACASLCFGNYCENSAICEHSNGNFAPRCFCQERQ